MKVTVGIKALNEERHIRDCLLSAIAAAEPLGGEVILADSGSTDGTIEIARALPVRIVQLENTAERCCGAGAQLAFQFARGDYFYLLDGDMILKPDFLATGIDFLEANPGVAAVGGTSEEMNVETEEFQIRAKIARTDPNARPGEVDRLDGGGLYRSAAVRDAGYFADRNLHAFEEFELGARLRARGWKLARIDRPAMDHYGHQAGGYALLWRRLKSGYTGASGEVFRAALGMPHLPIVLRQLSHIRVSVAVAAWWMALVLVLLAPGALTIKAGLWAGLLLGPLAFLWFRRGSLKLGVYSLVSWNVSALGFFSGLLRRREEPNRPLAAVFLAGPAGV